MITYSCDDAGCYAALGILPAADHKPGEMIEIVPRNKDDKRPPGKIPQVPHTYKLLGLDERTPSGHCRNHVRRQAGVGKSAGAVGLRPVMTLGLQRAAHRTRSHSGDDRRWRPHTATATRANRSPSPTRKEAWILEMVGTGPGGNGAVWVALRIPDGHISCHANSSRIGEFPRNEPANCLLFGERREPRRQQGVVRPEVGPAVPLLRRLLPRRRPCRGGAAMRGCGASCGGRRRRSTCRPTITAPSPARSLIRCRCRRTGNFPPPTSSP